MHKLVVFAALLASCAPYKPVPPTDAGSKDASTDAAKEASACVPDFQPCNGSVPCCVQSSVCNPGTLVCQTACLGVGNVCSVNGDCCSGICSGTCQ